MGYTVIESQSKMSAKRGRGSDASVGSIALVVLAMFLLCLPVAFAQGQEPIRGGRVTLGTLRDAVNFDPHLPGGTHNWWLLGNVYESLLEYDQQGNLVPSLAASWSYDDPQTLTLVLQQGVSFQDGSAFGAEDVVATLERIKDPETVAARQATAENIHTIEVLDDHTVRLHLTDPDFTLLHALAGNAMYIVSADDVAAGFNFAAQTNGTGPFRLGEWEPERQYVMVANPGYWQEGLPYLDEFVVQIIPEDRARTDALRSGQVDIADYIPWQDFITLQRDYTINTYFSLSSYLRVNHNHPPLDDPRVRQAIAFILDREEINDLAFGGEGLAMTGPLQPAGSPYYFPELEGSYVKDWDRALALLQEAGYASPADVPPLQMSVSTSAVATQPGLVVQQQLQSFGLQIEWLTVDVPTLQINRRDGSYRLHIDGGGMTWPDPDYLRPLFHSTAGSSHAVGVQYASPRLDELLELGNRLTDEDERREVYLEAERILLDELPIIFLLWRPQADAVASHVQGYVAHDGGLGSFNASKMEYVWRSR